MASKSKDRAMSPRQIKKQQTRTRALQRTIKAQKVKGRKKG